MPKKSWAIIIAAGALLSLSGGIWAVSSHWHSYTAAETIHEADQDEQIDTAMRQSTLAIIQQRMQWLEERIWELETRYGCPQCDGTVKRIWKSHTQEYKALQKRIEVLTKDG